MHSRVRTKRGTFALCLNGCVNDAGFPTEQKSTKEPAAVRPTRNAPKKLWEVSTVFFLS